MGTVFACGDSTARHGAWTGVLVATFLNMKMRQALPMIFLGVLAAGIVMVIGSYGLFDAIRLF